MYATTERNRYSSILLGFNTDSIRESCYLWFEYLWFLNEAQSRNRGDGMHFGGRGFTSGTTVNTTEIMELRLLGRETRPRITAAGTFGECIDGSEVHLYLLFNLQLAAGVEVAVSLQYCTVRW